MERKISFVSQPDFNAIHYEDGSGDLEFAVYREVEGVEITGNGTLQAPLTIKVKPGYLIVKAA